MSFHELSIRAANLLGGDGDLLNCTSPTSNALPIEEDHGTTSTPNSNDTDVLISQAKSSIDGASSNDSAATADTATLINMSHQLLAAHLNGNDDTKSTSNNNKNGMKVGSSASLKPPPPAVQDVYNVIDEYTRQLHQHSIADDDESESEQSDEGVVSAATSEYNGAGAAGGCGDFFPHVGSNNDSTGSYSALTESHSIDTEFNNKNGRKSSRYAAPSDDPFGTIMADVEHNENIRRSILSNVQAQRSKRRKVVGLGILFICLLVGGTALAASMGLISTIGISSDDANKSVEEDSSELEYVEPVNDTELEYDEEPTEVEYVCDEETGQYVVVSTSTDSSSVVEEEEEEQQSLSSSVEADEEEDELVLPVGITPSLLLQVINTPGFTIDMISNYHEFGTLPPGITEDMVVKMLPEGVALESLREVTPEMIMKVQEEEQSQGGGDVVDLNYRRRNLRTVSSSSGRRGGGKVLLQKKTSVRRRREQQLKKTSVSGRERALQGKASKGAKGAKPAIVGNLIDPEMIEGVYLFGSKCTKSPSISSTTPAEYASGLLEALEESNKQEEEEEGEEDLVLDDNNGDVIAGMSMASGIVEPVSTNEPSAKPTLKPTTASPTTARPTTSSPTTVKPTTVEPTIAPTDQIVIEEVLQEEGIASMSMLQIEVEEEEDEMGTHQNLVIEEVSPIIEVGMSMPQIEDEDEKELEQAGWDWVVDKVKDEFELLDSDVDEEEEEKEEEVVQNVTDEPSPEPTSKPTTSEPSFSPSGMPTKSPSLSPSMKPTTESPSLSPSMKPTTESPS